MQFGATPATATILGQVPVIAQDSFAQIFQQSAPGDYPNVKLGGSIPVIDTSLYQSVIIAASVDGQNVDFPINIPAVSVSWFGGPSNLFQPTAIDTFAMRVPLGDQGLGSASTPHIMTLPCRGSSMSIFIPAVPAAPADAVLDIAVFGSFRQLKPRYDRLNTLEWGASGVGSIVGNAADGYVSWVTGSNQAAGTYDERPPHRSGPATLTCEVTSISGGSVSALLMDDVVISTLGGSRTMNAIGITSQQVMLPRRPIRFRVIVPATFTATTRMTLVMQDNN